MFGLCLLVLFQWDFELKIKVREKPVHLCTNQRNVFPLERLSPLTFWQLKGAVPFLVEGLRGGCPWRAEQECSLEFILISFWHEFVSHAFKDFNTSHRDCCTVMK